MTLCVLALAIGCQSDPSSPNVRVCPNGTFESDGECVVPVDISVGPAMIGPARVGRAFVAQFGASGGQEPYQYSVEGELPEGLELSEDGQMEGTPQEAGTFEFEVIATDANDASGQVALTLLIEEDDGPDCIPSEEVCDGVDNDCDGDVDEDDDGQPLARACYSGPEGTADIGACQSGAETCVDGEFGACEGEVFPSDEVCDALDNDCDGEIDNGIPGLGEACGPEEGVCQRGETACVDGQEVCEGVVEEGEEVCDGVDNDCDGETDEDVLNACGECGDVPEEVCDGEDNDCDGLTDEDLLNACGECGPVPMEVCDGVDNDCDGFTDEDLLNACGECGEVPEEVCDGVDNDCDGETDEGCPCESGQREACGLDEGQCERGERECVNGQWGPCEGGQGPVDEICDDLDNNCDGETDENVLNACGECGPVPEEVCDGQDNDCDGQTDEDVLNACGECGPVPEEVCDGEDNDCDGQTDEGVLNACGECGPVPEEVCDGIDNDCDGQTDEGLLNACGECGPLPEEVCDGVDNDCDGSIDENLDKLGACQDGDNPCEGRQACVGGQIVCQSQQPSEEVCDGLDNDCDGETDEDQAGDPLVQTCSQEGCQSEGRQTCIEGAFEACRFPEEVCDGQDNNCDGQTDEGLLNACGECGEVPEEICDGIDNDCDGDTDEDAVGTGEQCTENPNACEPGLTECVDGQLACVGERLRTTEVCDGIDNDCDGQTDESFPEAGQICGEDRCGRGVTVCNGADGVGCDITPFTPGDRQEVPVEGGLIRAYSGTDAPFITDNGSSYSVLLASDGERIYNVAYGLDGQPFGGWTVRIFVPEPSGLVLQEEVTIEADWAQQNAQEFGFGGVATDGEVIYALNLATNQQAGQVWEIDPNAGTAEVAYFWNGRNTFESPAAYDAFRDQFWTVQLNGNSPFVFRYPGTGIDPNDEEERFRLQVPGNGVVGNIASDGRNLYGMTYSNAEQPQEVSLWRFGSGQGGTSEGGDALELTQIKAAASLAYHRDGFLYAPDQNNLNVITRVAATVVTEEVCDGIDNNCDDQIDEGDVCLIEEQEVDLVAAGDFIIPEVGRTFQFSYEVFNAGEAQASAHTDAIFLTPVDAPNQSVATLGVFTRDALAGGDGAFYEDITVEIPQQVPEGDYFITVVVDFGQDTEDVDRTSNVLRFEVTVEDQRPCSPDRLEPNDDFDEATSVGRFSSQDNLSICPSFDEDWFVIEVPGRRNQSIFLQANSNLDMYVYNSQGEEVEASEDDDNTEFIRFRNDSQQTQQYFIQIINADPNNGPADYVLTLGGV